jgi:hypothetical protein
MKMVFYVSEVPSGNLTYGTPPCLIVESSIEMGHGLHSQGTGAPACITSAYFINLKFAAFPDDFPNPRHDSRLRSRIIRPLSLQDQLLGPGPFGITMDFRPRCRPF